MPRGVKPQVATATEKRKAELFNQVDDLIATAKWDQALDNLHYLYRTTPSQRPGLIKKLAVIYQNKGEPETALQFLHKLLPSSDFTLNRMIVEALLALQLKDEAIQGLAKAPLTRAEKKRLFTLIESNSIDGNIKTPPVRVMIRCHACTTPQYFLNGSLTCLVCDMSVFGR